MSPHLRIGLAVCLVIGLESARAAIPAPELAAVPGPERFHCLPLTPPNQPRPIAFQRRSTSANTLRTYRLAMAATGEFTQFHGGTVSKALSAISNIVEQINAIYEPEVGIRLVLIPNNHLIVYTDPTKDPYSFNNSSETTVRENQQNLDQVIGSQNYDLGIALNTGRYGLSYIRSVCLPGFKAAASVGAPAPVGEEFIRLVAHEIGHQFGANHTFNSALGDCALYRHAEAAYEPGSGSTLITYTS